LPGDIWLPTEVVYETLETRPGDTPPTILWRYELGLSDWKVNQDLQLATFRSSIPEGAWVNDHRLPGSAAYQQSANQPAAESP
jgi:hypothetical protein